MADKTLSSIIGDEPTRNLVLINHDGTVHAAGIRGMVSKSIFNGNQWGFVPLINKGHLFVYSNGNMHESWALGSNDLLASGAHRGGQCASMFAPNGDLIVTAWMEPDRYADVDPASEPLLAYAFDGTTGALLQAFSITLGINYNAGTPSNDAECLLGSPVTDFYVCAIKYRATTGRWIMVGFNYNTSTQTLSANSTSSVLVTQGQTALSTTKANVSMNNANDEMVVLFADQADRSEFYSLPITGSAGAYLIGTPSVLAEQVQYDGAGQQKCALGTGLNSHMHRLSNDDIIVFGSMEAGIGTAQSYAAAGDFFINILDTSAVAITDSFYLDNEVPAATLTNKFYFHQCLFSWEIATDTYLLLTKNGERDSTTTGPTDFWTSNDGFNHIRAHTVEIDPGDNSMTYVDLGEFSAELFKGNIWKDSLVDQYRDRSAVYDWHLDITNTCIYMFTKSYSTKLQFTASFAATDMANSAIVFSPLGPKAQNIQWIDAADVWELESQEQRVNHSAHIHPEQQFSYHHATKRMWMPGYITYDNVSNQYRGVPMILVYDMEQSAGTDIECTVVSADANEVRVICAYDVFANNGMPVGSVMRNTFAVSEAAIIAREPSGHFLDILVGDVFVDGSQSDFLFIMPEGAIAWNVLTLIPPRINKGQCTTSFTLGQNLWNGDNDVLFNLDDADAAIVAANEGPMWTWDNLDSELWVWHEGGGSSTGYGNLILMSEGWWAAGNHGFAVTDTSGDGIKIAWQIKPSSLVEMHGRTPSNVAAIYMLKFRGRANDLQRFY